MSFSELYIHCEFLRAQRCISISESGTYFNVLVRPDAELKCFYTLFAWAQPRIGSQSCSGQHDIAVMIEYLPVFILNDGTIRQRLLLAAALCSNDFCCKDDVPCRHARGNVVTGAFVSYDNFHRAFGTATCDLGNS